MRKVPKDYPTGPAYPIDAEWRAKVLARMAEKRIRRSQLAKLIGCDPSSITILFRPDTVQSRLVPDIHRVLELPPPTATDGSPSEEPNALDDELRAAFAEMDEEGKRHFLHLARRILGKRSD